MSKKYMVIGFVGTVAAVAIGAPVGLAETSPEDSICYMIDNQGQFTDLGWMCGEVEEEVANTAPSSGVVTGRTQNASGDIFADAYIDLIAGEPGEALILSAITDDTLNPVESAVRYCEGRNAGLTSDDIRQSVVRAIVRGSGDAEVEEAMITHNATIAVLAPEFFCPEFR
jgi:hypothetical protein